MKVKVVIIHQSEIIRNGLLHMVRRSNNLEVEVYGKWILETKGSDNDVFTIVFIDEEMLNRQEIKEYKNEQFLVIPIRFCMKEGVIKNGNDYEIDLHCTLGQIRDVLGEVAGRYNEKERGQNSQDKLTNREVEVLKQIAQGYINKDIADNLFISLHTVISHRKNITEKLGIKSISGLTVYAIMNNLIDKENLDISALI